MKPSKQKLLEKVGILEDGAISDTVVVLSYFAILLTAIIGLSLILSSYFPAQRPHSVVEINGMIDNESVNSVVTALDKASYDDTIVIKINSGGGEVNAGLRVIHAIETTKANVVVKVSANAHSMAAVIACYAPVLDLSDYSTLMYHPVAYSSDTTVRKILPTTASTLYEKHVLLVYKKLMSKCAEHRIVTEADLKTIDEGGEVFILGTEAKKRINGSISHDA
jgi:ATP-dependent protease ClpP protease subunit